MTDNSSASAANPYQAPDSPINTPTDLNPIQGSSQYGIYRNPSILGKVVITALVIELIVYLANGWLAYNFLLQSIKSIPDSTYDFLFKVSLGTYYVCGILFLFWTARIVRNAWAVRRTPLYMNISPRWAAGFFLIPIVSWWYPYKAIMQARKECGIPGSPLYLWWWISWLTASISTLSGLMETTTNFFNYAIEIIYLAAGILAIFVVHRISTSQSRMATEGVHDPAVPEG